jgi:hypothetical protein
MFLTSRPDAGSPTSAFAAHTRALVAVVACLALAPSAGRAGTAPPPVVAVAVPPAATAEPVDAGTIKADMLCNLAKFVQWPEAMVSQNKGQLVVAVLGEDDLAGTIASVLSSRNVNGKPVFVRFARRVQDVRGCQIVYIAGSEISHVSDVVEALRGTATLTLADMDGFASRGGMVNFAGTAPNIRFEICVTRANQAGLKVSSRLLAVARVVEAAN